MRMQQTCNNVLLKSTNDLHLYFLSVNCLNVFIYLMLSRLIPIELPNGFINRPLCVLQLIIL